MADDAKQKNGNDKGRTPPPAGKSVSGKKHGAAKSAAKKSTARKPGAKKSGTGRIAIKPPSRNVSPDTDTGQQDAFTVFPASLFAAPLGFATIGFAWHEAAVLFDLPLAISTVFVGFAAGLLIATCALYALKAVKAPREIVSDIRNPLKAAHLAAAPAALILLAGSAIQWSVAVSEVLWLIGGAGAFLAAVTSLATAIKRAAAHRFASPSILLPASSLALAPLTGIALGYYDLSWMMFGASLALSLMVGTIVLAKLFLRGQEGRQQKREMDTLFFLVAPPAAAFCGEAGLEGGYAGDLGLAIFGIAILATLVVIPSAFRSLRRGFGMRWWAIPYPSGLLAIAALYYYDYDGGIVAKAMSFLPLTFSSLVAGAAFVLTMRALATGNLLWAETARQNGPADT